MPEINTLEIFLQDVHAHTRDNLQMSKLYKKVEEFVKHQQKRLTDYEVCVEAVLQALIDDSSSTDKEKMATISEILMACQRGDVESIFNDPTFKGAGLHGTLQEISGPDVGNLGDELTIR